MHASQRTKTLTNYVSSRLTQEEEDRIKDLARKAGITKSEWCRRAILQALDAGPDTRLVLSELLALRRILMALQLDSVQGLRLNELRLQEIVNEAESKKIALADSRILGVRGEQPK
jgi:predicted DNA-binding protein